MKPKEEAFFGIFNDGFPPILDGVTQTVLNYVDWLINAGHKACVVTPYNPEKYEVPYDVIRYFSLPIRSRHPYRYGYPKLDPYIWGKMRNTPFKLIHSHSPFAAGRLGVYAKKKQGVPLIGTFHSKYRSDLKHSFKYLPWCVPIIMKRILDFYNACDEVWIPQAAVEETIREYGYKGKVEVVENGIEVNQYTQAQLEEVKENARKILGIHDDEIALLFVGQHIWEKGIGIIVETLKKIDGEIPFKMNFIGGGYAIGDLQKKIGETKFADRVKIHGLVSDRDLINRNYAASDLFLFPSFYDNAPLVVREAASYETPSIIPKGSTASEVITEDVNGFLAEANPDAYAEMIRKLYHDRKKIKKAGEGAKATLVRGWNDVMEEVFDRYTSLINRK